MGRLISRSDLESAISAQTVLALFDDGSGNVSEDAISRCINSAEAEVFSYLTNYTIPSDSAASGLDVLLQAAAIDFAICLAYERKPEYGKFSGEDQNRKPRWDRAVARMERIQEGQQIPTTLAASAPPANVGGYTVDNSSRISIDSANGSSNTGDF
jgi:hypothetical protein